MDFDKEIKPCLEQIEELENMLRKVSDRLSGLKQRLQFIESSHSETFSEPSILIKEEEESDPFAVTFLGDKITRTIYADYADLKKSLTLNDRFRFQKDLLGNDIQQMDNTLDEKQ